MSTTHSLTVSSLRRGVRVLVTTMAIAPLAVSAGFAQTSLLAKKAVPALATEAMLALPESPGAISSSVATRDSDSPSTASRLDFAPAGFAGAQNVPVNNSPVAGRYDKYIKPSQQAPRLSVSDKVVIGVKDAFSPLSFIGWATAAEYSQLVDGSPNYGTNGKAYAQRLGAAAARASSQGIFSDSIMASVLREDPRYYKMGKGHSVFKRLAYAATRPIITRTDGGHQTLNLAYLSGNLAGAALTQAYYPTVNQGTTQVMQTWGGSIGGGAIGFVTSEFLDDILQGLHLQHAK